MRCCSTDISATWAQTVFLIVSRAMPWKRPFVALPHCAFPITPLRDQSKAHELQSIGTMYLLNACAEQNIQKFILASTTDVYGAHPTNPNYLTEKHVARGGFKSRFIRDKVDAENPRKPQG